MMRGVGGVRKSIHQSWWAKGLGSGLLCWNFTGVREEIPWDSFKSAQWHFHQDNTSVYNSILVTNYLSKMGIEIVPHRPYSPDLAPSDFRLFPKLRGCRYKTIEETKKLWRRSLTRSHKRTSSIGPSRSCQNGTKIVLQPEEITSKESRVSSLMPLRALDI